MTFLKWLMIVFLYISLVSMLYYLFLFDFVLAAYFALMIIAAGFAIWYLEKLP